ncbi:MAG: DUF5666 domain-containing protein [bacterium]|nr:DUF5666 domain-containing protein [bacterium]
MKKLFLIFTFYLLLFTLAPSVLAISPTPTPTTTTTPTEAADRVQQIKDRVAERIADIRDKSQIRAFWGTLKQINNSTLVLDTPRGEKRVKTDDNTKITLDKKSVGATDLAIGNFLIVIGTVDNTEMLNATKIMAFSKPPKVVPKRQVIHGKVTNITESNKTLTITNSKKPSLTYDVKVDNKTIITKFVDGKIQKVNFASIAAGDRIVAVAIKDTTTFTAKIIHVIPGKAVGQTDPEETITPTPKAKPKTSPTPTPVE